MAGGGGGLAVAEDLLHGGDVLFYLPVLFLQGGGEFLFDEAAVGIGIDDAEGVYLAAMRDDVVLQGGIAAVGVFAVLAASLGVAAARMDMLIPTMALMVTALLALRKRLEGGAEGGRSA